MIGCLSSWDGAKVEEDKVIARFAFGIKLLEKNGKAFYEVAWKNSGVAPEVVIAKLEAYLTSIKKQYQKEFDGSMNEFRMDKDDSPD